jgi:hypothetical protein
MYFYVEKPFRLRPGEEGYLRPSAFGLSCTSLALLLMFPAAHAWGERGWSWRVSEEIMPYMLDVRSLRDNKLVKKRNSEKFPHPDRVNGIVIGDSHATDIFNAFEYNDPKIFIKRRGISINCQPVVGERPFRNKSRSDECQRIFNKILNSGDLAGSDYIFFSARWEDWAAERIPETIQEIRKYSDAEIIIFGPTVEFSPEVPELIFRHGSLTGLEEYINSFKVQDVLLLNEKLKKMSELHGFTYIDKISVLCGGGICPVFVPGTDKLMFVDYGHWSNEGAAWFGKLLRQKYPELHNIF